MREVYAMLDSKEVYVVPNFISEGYFCQQVLPRELQVTGPVSQVGDKTVFYCDPVGIHPNMTRLLLQRADEVAPGVPRDQTSLIVVGHGTSLNENSRKVIEQQVALIRASAGFAEVVDAYMEEAPLVSDWPTLTSSPNVVVVPFFIADGLHSYQDIPVLLGFEAEVGAAASQREVFRHNPHHLHGRQLYYSSAIGTEPQLADVILDQVTEFDRRHARSEAAAAPGSAPREISDWLREQVQAGDLQIGQVRVRQRDGIYELCHEADISAAGDTLAWSDQPSAALEIARLDAQGEFRPLKSAPNLKPGWGLRLSDVEALRQALDGLYPAALGLAFAELRNQLEPVPLRSNLGRQTGMYRFTNTIRDDQAIEMVARCCDTATKCLRRVTWALAPGQPLYGNALAKTQSQATGALAQAPLLCVEVCPLVVGEARKLAQVNHAEKAAAAKEA